MCILCVCVHIFIWSPWRSHSLALELHMVVSCHVGDRIKPRSSAKAINIPYTNNSCEKQISSFEFVLCLCNKG